VFDKLKAFVVVVWNAQISHTIVEKFKKFFAAELLSFGVLSGLGWAVMTAHHFIGGEVFFSLAFLSISLQLVFRISSIQRRWGKIVLGVLVLAAVWYGEAYLTGIVKEQESEYYAGLMDKLRVVPIVATFPAKTPPPPKKRIEAPPFAVQVEFFGVTRRPSNEVTDFYVAYIGDSGKTLSPARMVIFLRITNLQAHPVMITRYSVKVGKTKMVKISGPPTESFYDGHGNIHSVCWINDSDLLDKNLEASNLQPRIPVQGLALFDYPEESRPESLNESDLTAMRFTITIIDAEGRSFTSETLQPKPDPSNETVQSRIVRFNRGTRDLSAFKIKNFTVSRGFTSPPF
jgi:hypothetical protein